MKNLSEDQKTAIAIAAKAADELPELGAFMDAVAKRLDLYDELEKDLVVPRKVNH